MTAPGQVWYLLKFLLFPTRFLGFILILVILGLLAATGLFYSFDALTTQIFYTLAVVLFTFLVMGFSTQLSLLAHRKTLVLCGSFSARLCLISMAIVAAWCLMVAPAMVSPLSDPTGFWRSSVVIAALLSLGFFIGALIRLNLLLIAFVVLAMSQPDAIFAAIGNAYREGSTGHYGILLAFTGALWICLYQRLKRARLPAPLAEIVSAGYRNRTPMGNPLGRLLPVWRPGGRLGNPARTLLLESRSYVASSFASSLLLTAAGALVLALYFSVQDESIEDVYRLVGGGLVLVPALLHLGSVEKVSTNLRRLWLLIPGSRSDLFRQLERSLLVTGATVVVPFALASAGLLSYAGEPLWWSLSWALYIGLTLALFSYLVLLTLAREHFWMPLARLLTNFLLMFIGLVFWISRSPEFVAGVIVALVAAVSIARALAIARWAGMDYSLLKNRVTRL